MEPLRCILAEWTMVRLRLWRTPFGAWLAGLGAVVVWLQSRSGAPEPLTAALLAGALAAVVGSAYAAGGPLDRAALSLCLAHPTTPLRIATGRWAAAALPAAMLAVLCTVALGGAPPAALAGIAAAGAVGGCAIAAVLALGNGAAAALFLYMAVAGTVAPERLVAVADPGVLRVTVAGVLELAPALWRYREIAAGDVGAVAHALAWTALGVVVAGGVIRRRGATRGGVRARAV